MTYKWHFSDSDQLGMAMGTALLAVLTEFTGAGEPPPVVVTTPPVVRMDPAVVADN